MRPRTKQYCCMFLFFVSWKQQQQQQSQRENCAKQDVRFIPPTTAPVKTQTRVCFRAKENEGKHLHHVVSPPRQQQQTSVTFPIHSVVVERGIIIGRFISRTTKVSNHIPAFCANSDVCLLAAGGLVWFPRIGYSYRLGYNITVLLNCMLGWFHKRYI